MMGNKLIGQSLANKKNKKIDRQCVYANRLRMCRVVALFATHS